MSRQYVDAFFGPPPAADTADASDAPEAVEIVVDRKTGVARQAGSAHPDGRFVIELRDKAERLLYVFVKSILGRQYLNADLHVWACAFLQRLPPHRKLLLLPREHAKTSIVGHGLPLHILIQPRAHNIYFPETDGADTRIVLVGETEQRSTDALRVIETNCESNETLRALWPHRFWEGNPRRESKKWNEREMILPRVNEYPDPHIRSIGVGGAITGSHPTVLIKDDLVTFEAANSPVVMRTAIEWHIASRALINQPGCLEFIIGTRWAVGDLYDYIQQNDPTVEVAKRSVVEDGRPIYPEVFTLDAIDRLQKEFGVLFPLLYMNDATSSLLTDFDLEQVRTFTLRVTEAGTFVEFDDDERDVALAQQDQAPPRDVPVGTVLDERSWQQIYQPGQGALLRFRS